MSLNGRKVKGVLLDITGVLAESSSTGDGTAIQGSVEAVKKLKSAGNI
jgi:ribonucleotide monophosphatase NagD (HAD superfamily)